MSKAATAAAGTGAASADDAAAQLLAREEAAGLRAMDEQQQQQQEATGMSEQIRDIARLFRIHKTVIQMLRDRGYTVVVPNADDEDEVDDENMTLDQRQRRWGARHLAGDDYEAFKHAVFLGEGLPLNRAALRFVCSKAVNAGGGGGGGNQQQNQEDDAVGGAGGNNAATSRLTCMVWYEPQGEKGTINTKTVQAIVQQAENSDANSILLIYEGKIQPIARQFIEKNNRAADSAFIETFPEENLVINITQHELVPRHEPLTTEEAQRVLSAYALNISMLPRILASDPVALYFGLKRGQVVRITRESETAGEYVTYRQVV